MPRRSGRLSQTDPSSLQLGFPWLGESTEANECSDRDEQTLKHTYRSRLQHFVTQTFETAARRVLSKTVVLVHSLGTRSSSLRSLALPRAWRKYDISFNRYCSGKPSIR